MHKELCFALHGDRFYGAWSWKSHQSWWIRWRVHTLRFWSDPDLDEGGHFHLVKQGNLRLELHFATQLPETINVIVYAEFDNVIEDDKARNVSFDYSAWIANSWFLYWSKIVIRLRCSMGSIRSIASHPFVRVYMSSIRLPTLILGCIG